MNRFEYKRRFIATFLNPRAIPRTYEEFENQHTVEEAPLGVTPPSPVRLPDSVLTLRCPRCRIVLYISRGHLASLTSSLEVVEALAPGQIDWFNPKHTPCRTLMRRVSLDENVTND